MFNKEYFIEKLASYNWAFSLFAHALPIIAMVTFVSNNAQHINSGKLNGFDVEIFSFSEYKPQISSIKQEKSSKPEILDGDTIVKTAAKSQQATPKSVNLLAAKAGEENYAYSLLRQIEKYKRYPKAAKRLGIKGEVVVTFILDQTGKLKEQNLLKASGYKILDKAAASIITKASRSFPPMPADFGNETIFTLPIVFDIHG